MSTDGRNLVTLPWEGVDGVAEPGRVRIWELDASPLGPPRTCQTQGSWRGTDLGACVLGSWGSASAGKAAMRTQDHHDNTGRPWVMGWSSGGRVKEGLLEEVMLESYLANFRNFLFQYLCSIFL